jgi:hypothetical protein
MFPKNHCRFLPFASIITPPLSSLSSKTGLSVKTLDGGEDKRRAPQLFTDLTGIKGGDASVVRTGDGRGGGVQVDVIVVMGCDVSISTSCRGVV